MGNRVNRSLASSRVEDGDLIMTYRTIISLCGGCIKGVCDEDITITVASHDGCKIPFVMKAS